MSVNGIGRKMVFLMLSFLIAGLTCMVSASNELTFMTWANASQCDLEKEVMSVFEAKRPDVKVNVICNTYGEHIDKLLVMIAGGAPPDLVHVDGYDYASLAARSIITDMTPWVERDGLTSTLKSQLHPAFYAELLVSGRLYSIAPTRTGSVVHFVNVDIFNKAGIANPQSMKSWTWDDFLKVAQRLTIDENGDKVVDQWALQRNNQLWWHWVWMNGGDIFDRGQTKSPLDETAAAEAIQWVADLEHKYMVTSARADFWGAQTALYEGWDTNISDFRKTAKFSWDIAPLPAGARGSISTSKGNETVMPYNLNAKNKELAWELMKFLASQEAYLAYGKAGRFFPPQREAAIKLIQIGATASLPPANLNLVLNINSRNLTMGPAFRDVLNVWNAELAPVWAGTTSARAAGQRIAEQSARVISEAMARISSGK